MESCGKESSENERDLQSLTHESGNSSKGVLKETRLKMKRAWKRTDLIKGRP